MNDHTDKADATTTTNIEPPENDAVEVKNPAALLAKNKDLLRKLAESNAALQGAQDALKTAQDAHATTAAQLRTARIDDPLAAIVKTLSPHPGLMTKTLEDLFNVELDADGKPMLLNKDGAPLTWQRKGNNGVTEEVPVTLNQESMMQWIVNGFEGDTNSPAALLPRAQGTGALGSNGFGSRAAKQTGSTTHVSTPTPPMPLGLR